MVHPGSDRSAGGKGGAVRQAPQPSTDTNQNNKCNLLELRELRPIACNCRRRSWLFIASRYGEFFLNIFPGICQKMANDLTYSVKVFASRKRCVQALMAKPSLPYPSFLALIGPVIEMEKTE